MAKIIIAILLFFVSFNSQSQAIYETYESAKLGTSRQLKILLPRGYSKEETKKYPVIVVLDGDYMFELVAGVVDYYSYWEDIPEAIIVGVNQGDTRYDDSMYSEQNSLPIEKGAQFFEFLGMELLPYIDKKYKTETFKVAIGHGETANFINYYLLKDNPVFHAYVAISPDLAPKSSDYIAERLAAIQTKTFYYMATSSKDVKSIKEKTEALNTRLTALDNKSVLYNYNLFEDATHYTLPAQAIPRALESIFLVFQPISKKEYDETILKLDSNPVDYLKEKYATIKELFGIDKQVLINDFKAIEAAIEKKETFEYFEDLGKLAREQYPKTLLGNYYLARFYENTNEPKKAMRTYQSAYILDEIGGFTKDLMLEKAAEIKADFGY